MSAPCRRRHQRKVLLHFSAIGRKKRRENKINVLIFISRELIKRYCALTWIGRLLGSGLGVGGGARYKSTFFSTTLLLQFFGGR